jgi:hypothetical protein
MLDVSDVYETATLAELAGARGRDGAHSGSVRPFGGFLAVWTYFDRPSECDCGPAAERASKILGRAITGGNGIDADEAWAGPGPLGHDRWRDRRISIASAVVAVAWWRGRAVGRGSATEGSPEVKEAMISGEVEVGAVSLANPLESVNWFDDGDAVSLAHPVESVGPFDDAG